MSKNFDENNSGFFPNQNINLSEGVNFENELLEVLNDSTNIQSGLSRYKSEFKNISDASKSINGINFYIFVYSFY